MSNSVLDLVLSLLCAWFSGAMAIVSLFKHALDENRNWFELLAYPVLLLLLSIFLVAYPGKIT